MTEDLFHHAAAKDTSRQPLTERLRPKTLDEVAGQQHLVGQGRRFRTLVEGDRVPSMILWGPPGTGKTTLARVVAGHTQAEFVPFSAVLGGVKEIREIIKAAKDRRAYQRRPTILFIDEIHRFNKAQQDALLPHVEDGTVVLIGATTENPSFEVNGALLSRCRLFRLQPIEGEDIVPLLRRGVALTDAEYDEDALPWLAEAARGDARRALTCLAAAADSGRVTIDALKEMIDPGRLRHDRGGDLHFDIVSAFIKSLRAGETDEAMYWMMRMLEGGEAPRYIFRRLIIFASEDVGNADPQALVVTTAAARAFEQVGLPEGEYALAQAVLYLSKAPKGRETVTALAAAREAVKSRGQVEVPQTLRNIDATRDDA